LVMVSMTAGETVSVAGRSGGETSASDSGPVANTVGSGTVPVSLFI
jgi:hypothetical protein